MNKEDRQRDWAKGGLLSAIKHQLSGCLGWLRFWLSWPFRSLSADRNGLKERRVGFFRMVTYPIFWGVGSVLYVVANSIELIVGWSRTRQSRTLLLGIPAIVSLALFLTIIIYLLNTRNGELINTYLLKATKAETVEQYQAARMYYQKLLQIDQSNQSYEFLIARSFDSEGNRDEATRRMHKLSRQPDIKGSVNLWFAKTTLEREDLEIEEKWILCLNHLRVFLDGAPKHFEANSLAVEACTNLTEIYLLRRDNRAAAASLRNAEKFGSVLASLEPRSLLPLARIQRSLAGVCLQLNQEGQHKQMLSAAKNSALNSIAYYEKQVDKEPNSVEGLLRLADSYLFQKNHEQAVYVLDDAIRNDSTKRITGQLKDFKSEILSDWAAENLRKGTRNLSRCLELVDHSIQLDPKNQKALAILAQISVMTNEEVSLSAKLKLDQAIGEASAPFAVHLVLGNHAAVNHDDELAVKHLRQALLLNRRATAVMNNLAFVLSRLNQPRFEQALGLINNALKIIPGNPRFLETRGNIYLKMKQYELAFHDFETAEVQVKDNKSLYQNLLFLSPELGFDDLYRRKYEKRLADLAAGEVSAD
ncbi:MAG: hypothetical protein VX438_13350 [Planctomycetota bacterium]|nr:hypothetical protein [Planctomycetota bacterium]